MTATGIEDIFLRHNAGRHFVALQYRLRKDKAVHNLFASCFLLELAGTWFLITAGHWLKHEETGLERLLAAGYRIDKVFLADAFAGHSGSPLPFSFEVADWLTIYDEDEGFDFAALEIHPFHRRGLTQANVSAIELHATGPAEFHDDSQLAVEGALISLLPEGKGLTRRSEALTGVRFDAPGFGREELLVFVQKRDVRLRRYAESRLRPILSALVATRLGAAPKSCANGIEE